MSVHLLGGIRGGFHKTRGGDAALYVWPSHMDYVRPSGMEEQRMDHRTLDLIATVMEACMGLPD